MSEMIMDATHEGLGSAQRAGRNIRKITAATLCSLAIYGEADSTSLEAKTKSAVEDNRYVVRKHQERIGVGDSIALECGNPGIYASSSKQIKTMECLLMKQNPNLVPEPSLETSSTLKTLDVIRCGFSHFACDRQFNHYFPEDKFTRTGENLAWGGGKLGSAQEIFKAWMRSLLGHRENIIDKRWDSFGVSAKRVKQKNYWTLHFGEYEE